MEIAVDSAAPQTATPHHDHRALVHADAIDLTSDSALSELRARLEAALFDGESTLHVDLSSVRECNMGVIAMLVWGLAIAQQRSRRLVLTASPIVEKWLDHSKVSVLFSRFRAAA